MQGVRLSTAIPALPNRVTRRLSYDEELQRQFWQPYRSIKPACPPCPVPSTAMIAHSAWHPDRDDS